MKVGTAIKRARALMCGDALALNVEDIETSLERIEAGARCECRHRWHLGMRSEEDSASVWGIERGQVVWRIELYPLAWEER